MFDTTPSVPGEIGFWIGRTPVRVHPFFWLFTVFLGLGGARDVMDLVAWVAAAFISILFHELGHAYAARWYGFRPSILLYGMGGVTSYDPGYGRRRGPVAQIVISLAGPLAGFAVAAAIGGLLSAFGNRPLLIFVRGVPYVAFVPLPSALLTIFIRELLTVSIAWGLLNLMPVFPLDGGQIVREIFSVLRPRQAVQISLMISIATAVVLALLALLLWRSTFMAIVFGYLAYTNIVTLRHYGQHDRW